jgi:hypothetical protein
MRVPPPLGKTGERGRPSRLRVSSCGVVRALAVTCGVIRVRARHHLFIVRARAFRYHTWIFLRVAVPCTVRTARDNNLV